MLRNLRIGFRLTLSFFLIALISIAAIGYISYSRSKQALENNSFDLLTAVREMKAVQIEDYFTTINDQITTFAQSPSTSYSLINFKEGFRTLYQSLDTAHKLDKYQKDSLIAYYKKDFLPHLNQNMTKPVGMHAYFPQKPTVQLIQNLYIAANPHPAGEKHKLDDAGDGSAYSNFHKRFHPYFRTYLEKFGFYDIFLIDDETGHIIYTVFKEVDFGTSLLDGPYQNTNFAKAFLQARETDSVSAILVDYEPYHPSYNAPAAFIAAPVYREGERVGIVAFQMPIDRINNIMTSHQNWADVGLGESGETYIVGEDYTLRNQSRFLIEDSENYFRMIRELGVADTTIKKIQNFGSAIGLQEVKTVGTKDALNGGNNTRIFDDYRGVSVLSSYKPLEINGMKWVIMSEIDEDEAFAPVYKLRNGLLVVFLVLIPVILLISFVISRRITKPLKELTSGARQLAKGNMNAEIMVKGKDEIGILSLSFKKMQVSIKNLIGELRDINSNLENKVKERTAEIERHRDMLSEKNKEIVDSINYAERLQRAILPTIEKIQIHLSQSFILFKPKDIVSGDFYWMDIRDDEMLIAAVDCTGHGVPGAMVSVVGSNSLNRCIKEYGLKYPAEILDKLTDLVIETFATNSGDVKDGMDIALCSINLKNKKMIYSGAHNPLWILRKGDDEITEIKANKQPIGLYEFRKPFINHEIQLEAGDSIYLFSDGYADQFGGPRGKKFKYKTLKELLVEHREAPMDEQKNILNTVFEQWRGDFEQVDDVCVVGIRI